MRPESPFAALASALANSWRAKARPEQLPPPGDWAVWLLMAGRGFGKSRTGAETVQEWVMTGVAKRICLVAATTGDVRNTLIEGKSGILNIAPPSMRPTWEPSKCKLTWPNGATALTYSADEPDRLRGPEFDAAWADELAAWRFPQAWDNLSLALRLGRPRTIVTTTPRPTKLIRELLAREGGDVVVTRGKTTDNAANLPPEFIERIERQYAGTRLGRQEIDGELLQDTPGALWQRDWIDRDRVAKAPNLKRVVVAIDPAVSNHEGSDQTGLVVAGIGFDDHAYILDDRTAKYAPLAWARKAIDLFHEYGADRIVAEANQGGDLVETTLRTIDRNIAFRKVHASRGKVVRAEPVSSLYEQRRVHHVGSFPALEDQLCAFTSDFNRSTAGYSPDALDALVWAVTELAVKTQGGHFAIYTYGGRCTYDSSKPRPSAPNTPDWVLRGDRYPPGDARLNSAAVLSSKATR